MSTPNGKDPKTAIKEGVDAAFLAAGFMKDDGTRDKPKLRERMCTILDDRKVTAEQDWDRKQVFKERNAKAITRGEMVKLIFPSLPEPEAFFEQGDPQLAQAIWDDIDKLLWAETTTSAVSALQRLVGLNMGNGYVLCRVKITENNISACYVTDAVACIETDFIGVDNQILRQIVNRLCGNREMLLTRQPQNAKRYAENFNASMKAIQTDAQNKLRIAIAATVDPSEGSGDDDQD